MKRVIPLLALLTYSAYSHAAWVNIDASDYAVGTQITSNYVRLVSVDDYEELPVYRSTGLLRTNPDIDVPVFTELANGRPTGYTTNNTGLGIQHGLLFEFADPVNALDVDVISAYAAPLFLDTFAFTADGTQLDRTIPDPHFIPSFEVTTTHFDFGDTRVTRFYIGGGDQIGQMYFSAIRFNVPEPSTLSLLALGLLPIITRRKKRPCITD